MANQEIFLRKEEPIAYLIFNRPEKRNALTLNMWKTIPRLLQQVQDDPSIKVLILRGVDGTAFAAGADISEFRTLRTGKEQAELYNKANEEAEQAIATLSKPTIAMIQGYCIGGGCGIALACDLRFADTTARFGITPARLGIIYGFSATKRLVEVVGPSFAKYLLFSGRHIDSQRAAEIGLVNELYSPTEIEERTREFALQLADNAQLSIRGTKLMVQRILEGQTGDTEETARLQAQAFESEDYREGVQAFLEKRKPRFTNS